MKILVTGGTGTVGSQVVRELAARKADVSVLTRDPAKTAGLPAGVKTVKGDLSQVSSVKSVFNGYDGVFLLNPVSQTEASEGLLAVCGMMLAGTRRIVYMSVQDADKAPWLPHFGGKVGIEDGIKSSGIPYTILRPSNFFQNDYWFKDVILQYGVYPQPLGSTGVSRVDVRDIAEAAAIAFTTDAARNETVDLVGPAPLTGADGAKEWSRALKREIKYGGDDLDAWEKQFLQYMPDWMVFDFKLMFDHFHKKGLKASPDAVPRLTQLLGHPPRDYASFVGEAAASWAAV